jgi:4-amino-4-deoxy-L-arabinose transferase-like glycosyltransferase
MKKMWNVALAMSRPVLLGIIALILVTGLMGFRLASLTPGLSTPEIATYESADSFTDILDNSVNAPYKTAVFLSTRILNNALGLRLVSAILGVITVTLFYIFAYKLLKPTVAIGVTALFATSSMLLHTTRLATPDVMLFSLLALMAIGYIVRFDKHHAVAWIAATIIIALSLYVPGMVIFILAGAIWQFRHVRRTFEELRPLIIIICATILSLLVAPIVVNLIRSPELWRAYLGIPSELAPVSSMVKEVGIGLSSLFLLAPEDPIRWLGRQPALEVFSIVMFLFGLLTLLRQYKLDRLWALFGIFILTLIWTGFTVNYLTILTILPFVYIVVGIGIENISGQWLHIFPRNPIARATGISLVVIALVLAINFQMQRYFIAWPNNSDTKQAFDKQISASTP